MRTTPLLLNFQVGTVYYRTPRRLAVKFLRNKGNNKMLSKFVITRRFLYNGDRPNGSMIKVYTVIGTDEMNPWL